MLIINKPKVVVEKYYARLESEIDRNKYYERLLKKLHKCNIL